MNVEQIVSRFTMETIPDFERSSSCDDAKNQSGNLFLIRAPIYHHFSPRFSSLKKKDWNCLKKTENERKCYAWIFTPKIAKKVFAFVGNFAWIWIFMPKMVKKKINNIFVDSVTYTKSRFLTRKFKLSNWNWR